MREQRCWWRTRCCCCLVSVVMKASSLHNALGCVVQSRSSTRAAATMRRKSSPPTVRLGGRPSTIVYSTRPYSGVQSCWSSTLLRGSYEDAPGHDGRTQREECGDVESASRRQQTNIRMGPRVPTDDGPRPGDMTRGAERDPFLKLAASGRGVTTRLSLLRSRLDPLKSDIFKLTSPHPNEDGEERINLNSPRQLSKALFGVHNQSTNKDTLEAMASAGNRLADLILQYRKLLWEIRREEKTINIKERGTRVTSLTAPQSSSANCAQPSATGGRHPLVLVDASAYIFRAYYSMPPLHRRDGTPIGAVLGFCNMLNRLVLNSLLRGIRPRVVLVFDSKGPEVTFRRQLYPAYKANRKPCPVDLIPQFGLIREAATAYGIHQLEAQRHEADDVIATLATMALDEGCNVNILSGDKDLMQLVTSPQDDASPSVHMIDPMTMTRLSHHTILERWGVPPERLGDVLALAGDASDNIPGVPGIGPKIAATLINEFGSLHELLERVDDIPQKGRREKIREHADMARLSRRLVELDRTIPLEEITIHSHTKVSDFYMEELRIERLLAFYDRTGLRDLKRRVELMLDRRPHRDWKQPQPPQHDDDDSEQNRNEGFVTKDTTIQVILPEREKEEMAPTATTTTHDDVSMTRNENVTSPSDESSDRTASPKKLTTTYDDVPF